jgi:thioredoxin 1
MVKFLENLDQFKEAAKGLMIIDFTASWCPPCKMIGPKFEALAEASKNGKLSFFKVDVDVNTKAAQLAGIEAMPTFQVWGQGKKVAELVGADEKKLKELVAKYN